jgi:murein DD-endopeptidase MepM/ murein hydrolase activator NlpD
MKRWLQTTLIGLMAIGPLSAETQRESFDVLVPQAPIPVLSEGHVALIYELHLTNFANEPLLVRKLRVINPDSGKAIASFDGSDLANRFARVGDPVLREGKLPNTAIRPGGRAIIFIELGVNIRAVPKRLQHEIIYAATGDNQIVALQSSLVAVNSIEPVVLGPPFRNGIWAAVHAPSWARGHRRTTYTLSGKVRIPGRYAIDWMGLDEEGRITHGDLDRPEDAIGYGASVLAGADAEVASVRDGVAESSSVSNNPKHALGYGSGNYVALNLGFGRYAFYEHLRTGSIRVRMGQHVHLGQVIGALGFSGDTTGPHLHLHVADGANPMEAEGLPFVLDHYTEIGRYDDIGGLGRNKWKPLLTNVTPHSKADWPGSNIVVRFDERSR